MGGFRGTPPKPPAGMPTFNRSSPLPPVNHALQSERKALMQQIQAAQNAGRSDEAAALSQKYSDLSFKK